MNMVWNNPGIREALYMYQGNCTNKDLADMAAPEAKKPADVEPPPQAAETGAPWQREIVPDDVFLFRYSALTFNGPRMHYARRYVTEAVTSRRP